MIKQLLVGQLGLCRSTLFGAYMVTLHLVGNTLGQERRSRVVARGYEFETARPREDRGSLQGALRAMADEARCDGRRPFPSSCRAPAQVGCAARRDGPTRRI